MTTPAIHLPEGMRLSVPWNGDWGLLERLVPYRPRIANFYLPFHSSIAWTTREFDGLEDPAAYRREVDRLAGEASRLGAGLTLLANLATTPVDVDALVAEARRVAPLVPRLRVTFADFRVARKAAPSLGGIEIGVSIVCAISHPQQAWYWRELVGAGHLTVAGEAARRPGFLARLKEMGFSVGVHTCDKCVPSCPYHQCPLVATRDPATGQAVLGWDRSQCQGVLHQVRFERPWILASSEILPGHLPRLAGLVDEVKLPSREFTSDEVMEYVRLYAEARSLRHPEGFYEEPPEAWEQIAGCDRDCSRCDWCATHLRWTRAEPGNRPSYVLDIHREAPRGPSAPGPVAPARRPDPSWTFAGPGGLLVRVWAAPAGPQRALRTVADLALYYQVLEGERIPEVMALVGAVGDALEAAGCRAGEEVPSLPASTRWPAGFRLTATGS